MIVVHRPTPVLAPYIDLLWHDDRYAGTSHRERILPAGAFTITIELASGLSTVNGLRSTYIEVDTTPVQTIIGVLFRSGGWRAFVDASGEEFYNQSVPLDLVCGPSANELWERMRETQFPQARLRVLEEELLRRMRPRVVLHPAVAQGLRDFRRAPHVCRVLEVVKDAGLSRRRFSQLFREQVGLTPKLYCRLRRFHRVVCRIASGMPVDWANVAVAGGYSDQAHMGHEFREFSGLSPGAFLNADRPSGAHVRVS